METKITKTVKSGTSAQTRPDKDKRKGLRTTTAVKTTTVTKTVTSVTKSEPVITTKITYTEKKQGQ